MFTTLFIAPDPNKYRTALFSLYTVRYADTGCGDFALFENFILLPFLGQAFISKQTGSIFLLKNETVSFFTRLHCSLKLITNYQDLRNIFQNLLIGP